MLACNGSDAVIGLKRTIERELGEVLVYQSGHKIAYIPEKIVQSSDCARSVVSGLVLSECCCTCRSA